MFLTNGDVMKSVLFALFAAVTLAACSKKDETPAPAPATVVAPASAPVASEPAKTEEAKK